MSDYTEFKKTQESIISPEDENYAEELMEAARSFRPFSLALDEFLVQRGFEEDAENVNAKISFIKSKFDEASIPFDMRNPKRWFIEHKRSSDRKIAFQFCFAFGLNLEQTQDFFRRIYLQRGIDCHDINEAIYYYCIKHGLSYTEAQELIDKAPACKKGNIDLNGEVLFTGSIIKELDRLETKEELLLFLNQNSEQFRYNNATAYKYINRLWKSIAAEDGIANQEEALLFRRGKVSNKKRSVWDIYLQIFGYIDYDELDNNSKLFVLKTDRSLHKLLKNNNLINPIAAESFPDRQGLEGIIRGEHQSSETVRKTIIMLGFYRFWAALSLKNNDVYYTPKAHEAQRCLAEIDRLLIDTGYPNLYEGNPFDWIFMFASQDTFPLDAFRFFMREVYLNKEENTHDH